MVSGRCRFENSWLLVINLGIDLRAFFGKNSSRTSCRLCPPELPEFSHPAPGQKFRRAVWLPWKSVCYSLIDTPKAICRGNGNRPATRLKPPNEDSLKGIALRLRCLGHRKGFLYQLEKVCRLLGFVNEG